MSGLIDFVPQISNTLRLKIIAVNYMTDFDWRYKLSDGIEDDFYIMFGDFYESRGLKNPASRLHLDYLNVGHWLSCGVEVIDRKKIIVNFI